MKNQYKAIVGLGNPGANHYFDRHSIGFRVLDQIADELNANWKTSGDFEYALVSYQGLNLILAKPLTYMNNSGLVIPFLKKKGVEASQVIVVHDELELAFGKVAFKVGGSAKGHNGLRSIISHAGTDTFARIRYGIGRPEQKEDVPDFVLQPFSEPKNQVDNVISSAVQLLYSHIA